MPTNGSGPKNGGSKTPQPLSTADTAGATAEPLTSDVTPAVNATTALSASGQAQQTGDQSEAPGGRQVVDITARAPATSVPLGIPLAVTARSAFDQLRDAQPDHPLVTATKPGDEPRGDQAMPAVMTPSGSLPILQTAGSHAQALARIVTSPTDTPQDVGRTYARRHRIPEDYLRGMGRAELRAAAADRGYDIGDTGGRGVMVKRFIEAQEEDEALVDRDDELAELAPEGQQATTADTAPTTTTGAGEGGTSTDQAAPQSEDNG